MQNALKRAGICAKQAMETWPAIHSMHNSQAQSNVFHSNNSNSLFEAKVLFQKEVVNLLLEHSVLLHCFNTKH